MKYMTGKSQLWQFTISLPYTPNTRQCGEVSVSYESLLSRVRAFTSKICDFSRSIAIAISRDSPE